MGNKEITITDLVGVALKHIKIIIIVMLAGAVLAFCYSSFMVMPVYQSVSTYFVDTGSLTEDSNTSNKIVEAHNVTVFSRQVVSSYIGIFDTLNFASAVAEELADSKTLEKTYDDKDIYNAVSYEFEEDLEIYTVTVKALSPDDAFEIAKCIETISEEYLVTKIATAAGTVKIIDNARINLNPVNIRTSLSVIIGAFLGAVAAFAVCFLIEINDVRVKNEKELSDILELPIIGSIPEYSVSVQEKYYYKKK